MAVCLRRALLGLVPLLIIGVLLAVLPAAPVARANTNPNPTATWAAWGLAVEFPNQQPRVRFVSYVGDSTPRVLAATPLQDITDQCIIHGTFSYDGDYAIFDGATNAIVCDLPDWRAQVQVLAPHLNVANQDECNCPPDKSPFWVSADVVLHPVAAANPLVDAREAGYTFSLPSNGSAARTKIERQAGVFLSPSWTLDPDGKRVLVGQYGRVIEAVVTHFNGLQYLVNHGWRDFFKTEVNGNRMGQWTEAPAQSWWTTMPANTFTQQTGSIRVYIGTNPTGSAFFNGKVSKIRIDPGCFGE